MRVPPACAVDFDPVDTSSMFNQNRVKVLNLIYSAPQHIPGELVFLLGNPQEERTNSDTDILFRQDSNFLYARPAGRAVRDSPLTMRCRLSLVESNSRYLTGYNLPDVAVAIDVDSGQTMMFVPRKSRSELIFDGGLDDFEQIKAETGADWVFYDDEAVGELQDRFQMSRIHTHDADELVAAFPLLASYDIDDTRLRSYIFSARMDKSTKELELLRVSAQVTSKAHENVIRSMVPGTTEYETESKFLFACNNCGLRFQSYIPIVGAGKNGAVLHYGTQAHARDATTF